MTRYVVARAAEIDVGQSRRFDIDRRPICVFNVDGEYFALFDRCPHEGASLCRGDRTGLVEARGPGEYNYSRQGEILKCPWHGWEFDIRTGRSVCSPSGVRVRNYPANVVSGETVSAIDSDVRLAAETIPVTIEDDYIVVEV